MVNKRFVVVFIVLLISLFLFSSKAALADNATASAKVKYDLAYPGLLPDSPLYKLKELRDRIEYEMISDPQKQINFLLLQADKGVLASAILVDKGEVDLAGKTALKAENNYTLITQVLGRLSKQPTQSFFDTLKKASLKHQEVMTSLVNRVPKAKQVPFQDVIYFSQQNYQQIEHRRSEMWQ